MITSLILYCFLIVSISSSVKSSWRKGLSLFRGNPPFRVSPTMVLPIISVSASWNFSVWGNGFTSHGAYIIFWLQEEMTNIATCFCGFAEISSTVMFGVFGGVYQQVGIFNVEAAAGSCVGESFLSCFCAYRAAAAWSWGADTAAGTEYDCIHFGLSPLFFVEYQCKFFIDCFCLHRLLGTAELPVVQCRGLCMAGSF